MTPSIRTACAETVKAASTETRRGFETVGPVTRHEPSAPGPKPRRADRPPDTAKKGVPGRDNDRRWKTGIRAGQPGLGFSNPYGQNSCFRPQRKREAAGLSTAKTLSKSGKPSKTPSKTRIFTGFVQDDPTDHCSGGVERNVSRSCFSTTDNLLADMIAPIPKSVQKVNPNEDPLP